MKTIIATTIILITTIVSAHSYYDSNSDSVRITIGDTITIEDPGNDKTVEVIIDDLKNILGVRKNKTDKPPKVIVVEKKKEDREDFRIATGTNDGIRMGKLKKNKKRTYLKTNYIMLDWGINALNDKTNYTSPNAQNFMRGVPSDERNANFFDLRAFKSMNVNLYPIMLSLVTQPSSKQRFLFSTGIGFQFYNFKFTQPLNITEGAAAYIYKDNRNFNKNKLGVTYAAIPFQVTSQTKIGKRWLTYGIGVMGGYKIDSWLKQKTREDGKQKNHDPFNIAKTNFSVTGELGIKGILRLYANYQLTNMWQDGIEQSPISIGIRFFGI